MFADFTYHEENEFSIFRYGLHVEKTARVEMASASETLKALDS